MARMPKSHERVVTDGPDPGIHGLDSWQYLLYGRCEICQARPYWCGTCQPPMQQYPQIGPPPLFFMDDTGLRLEYPIQPRKPAYFLQPLKQAEEAWLQRQKKAKSNEVADGGGQTPSSSSKDLEDGGGGGDQRFATKRKREGDVGQGEEGESDGAELLIE